MRFAIVLLMLSQTPRGGAQGFLGTRAGGLQGRTVNLGLATYRYHRDHGAVVARGIYGCGCGGWRRSLRSKADAAKSRSGEQQSGRP